MTAKRTGKTTAIQYEKLLNYMEGHRELAHGRLSGPNSKRQTKKEWEELAKLLNCELGPHKEPKQWQGTWNDWKCSIKKKWKNIEEGQKKTGGGSPTKQLSEVEERLLGVIGYTALIGDGETPEGGLLTNSNIPPLSPPPLFCNSPGALSSYNLPTPVPTAAPLSTPPRNPSRKRKLDDGVIIDNQNKHLKVMEEIGLKLENLNNNVKDCANAIREQTECIRQLITLLIKK